MKIFNNKGLLVGATALAMSISAQAAPINVAGITWDPEVGADFDAGSNIFEGALNPGPDGDFFTADDVNTEVAGYGQISDINGSNDFCTAGTNTCELTFQFGGYELETAVLNTNNGSTDFTFSGGWINFYVDTTPNFDASIPSSLHESQATDGVLWLSMLGHATLNSFNGLYSTLAGNASVFGTGADVGTGGGLLSVITDILDGPIGAANNNFDTDGKDDNDGGLADMSFSSTFAPALFSNITSDGMVLEGDADFSGNSIPEPSSIALLGLGLLGFVGARKRKA